jgi:hypothetical protein
MDFMETPALAGKNRVMAGTSKSMEGKNNAMAEKTLSGFRGGMC